MWWCLACLLYFIHSIDLEKSVRSRRGVNAIRQLFNGRFNRDRFNKNSIEIDSIKIEIDSIKI